MLDAKVLAKIRHLEIKTKRVMRGMLLGSSKSVSKGFGFDFDQIRPYQLGDDIRFIDWNSSTRKNALLVKQYHQEQNKTVLLVVDVSASQYYGSVKKRKSDMIAEIGAILAFASKFYNDAIALILVSDHIECYIPPGKGKKHAHSIIEALFMHQASSKKTNLACALRYIGLMKYRNMFVVLLSDFIDSTYEKQLTYIAKKHDLVGICCFDPNELKLPAIGFVTMIDQETGKQILLDLRDVSKINHYLENRLRVHKKTCAKYGIPTLNLSLKNDITIELISFFNQRLRGGVVKHKGVGVQ